MSVSGGRKNIDLVWRAPQERMATRLRRGLTQFIGFPKVQPSDAVAAMLQQSGIPVITALGSEQDGKALASKLLDVAAELEHALMVEYLYAAYSIKEPNASKTVATIAVQEMGHLATVQNLRLALGLRGYMGRQDLAPNPEQDPFVFRRERASLDSIAKYAASEMPARDQVPADLEDILAEILGRASSAAHQAVRRVGAIYATLYWVFLPTAPEESRPWPNFPEESFRGVPQLQALAAEQVRFQAEAAEWRASSRNLHVVVIDSGASALDAIYRIASQGEGFSHVADSHFHRFVEVYRQMRDENLQVHQIPDDPNETAPPVQAEQRDPTSVAVGAVLDAAYAALQIEFLITLCLDRAGPLADARRALVTHLVSDSMQGAIGPLALRLSTSLPLVVGQAADDMRRAGPAFTACTVTEGMLESLMPEWLLAIDKLEARMNDALAQPDPSGGIAGDMAAVQDLVDAKRELHKRIATA